MSWSGTFLRCRPGADVLWHCPGPAKSDIILLEPTGFTANPERFISRCQRSPATCLRQSQVCFHSPRPYCNSRFPQQYPLWPENTVHQREDGTFDLTGPTAERAHAHTGGYGHTGGHWETCLGLFTLTHTHTAVQLLSHLLIYTNTHAYANSDIHTKAPWAALPSTAYIGSCLVRQYSNWMEHDLEHST